MTIETRLRSTGVQPQGGGSGSSNSAGLAGTGPYYILGTANATLPNSFVPVAGANVQLSYSGTNFTIAATTGGGSSSSAGLMGTGSFLITWSSDPLLTNQKVMTAGSSVTTRTDTTNFYIDATTANALAFVLTSRAVNTTYPLAGGGNLSVDRTFTADTAFIVTSNRLINTTFPLAGGGNLGADRTLTANTTFLVTSNRLINTTSPVGGGGNLGADLTITVGSLGTIGSANQFTRTNTAGTAWDYINFRSGSSTTVSHGSGFIQIDASTGGGSVSSAGLLGTGGYFFVQSGNSTMPNAIVMKSGQQAYITLQPQQAKLYASTSACRIDAGTPTFRALFSVTTQQFAIYNFQMPMDYGSAPLLRLLFGSDSTAAVAQSAFWKIDTWGVSPGGALLGAYQDTFGGVNTGSVNLANPWTAGNIVMLTIPLATVVSFGANNLIRLRISGSGAAGLVGNLELFGATFEYMKQ